MELFFSLPPGLPNTSSSCTIWAIEFEIHFTDFAPFFLLLPMLFLLVR